MASSGSCLFGVVFGTEDGSGLFTRNVYELFLTLLLAIKITQIL
jgi:hypothetical protein